MNEEKTTMEHLREVSKNLDKLETIVDVILLNDYNGTTMELSNRFGVVRKSLDESMTVLNKKRNDFFNNF